MNDKESFVKNIVYNDDEIVKFIKESPHTYNSILGEFKDCGTYQYILRRRISRLLKQQKLWKLTIPGTRFGLVLFCVPDHDYKMLAYDRIVGKTRLFYMLDYVIENNFLVLKNYWELKGPNWSKWEYCDDVLKIPKLGNRSDVVRLWE